MSGRVPRLRSDDPDLLALAFEQLVLGSFGIGEEDVERLGGAYRALSRQLLSRAPDARSGGFEGADPEDISAVWALVYGWRTFARTRALTEELGSCSGRVVELGSGWGPAGLAFGLDGASVLLVEPELAATRSSHRIYGAAELESPAIQVSDARFFEPAPGDWVVLPFSLWEMFPSEEGEATVVAKLSSWVRAVGESGRVIVLESGTREASRRLQTVRDAVSDTCGIIGPCRGASSCPKLEPASEWCHFTWNMRPGPLTRRLMDLAGRRWQEVHGSWLVLNGSSVAYPAEEARVLDVRRRGKGKIEAEVCSANGVERLVALKRSKDAFQALDSLPPGGRVALDRAHLESKGDGLRLTSAEALQPVRST